jgi:hypothetical protein
MTQTIIYAYSISDSVKIKAIGIIGQVDGLSSDEKGNSYRVVYWNDGSRCSVWMYEWELGEMK